MRAQADLLGDRPFLWAKRHGVWTARSWRGTAQAMDALARGLVALGLEPGGRVALVSENRPEWVIADLAVMAAGGITVPAYTTNTPDDHAHILTNTDARIIIVSNPALAQALGDTGGGIIIGIDSTPGALSWDAVIAQGAGHALPDVSRSDIACIIHTSGTGGAPKGVMLPHGAILADIEGARDLLADFGLADEVFLSFLPLSHAYEHTAGLYLPLRLGAQIYFAESIERLAANMAEVRPTLILAVPRLYETMRARILDALRRKGGLAPTLFHKAVAIGSKRTLGECVTLSERLLDPLLDRLVRRKVQGRFGGRLKALVSGGAPLAFEVGLFFTALGVRILQGYGQTEAAPVISCNPPGRVRLDTVGPPLAGVLVRLAADGEILVQGETLMRGYWNDPDATARVLSDDGWLATGDIGEIDPDGYLRITDRKRDIIVNSGGDNISPSRVEARLTQEPEILQAVVEGDRRPHLVAVLVAAEGSSREAVARAVARVNQTLSPIERVRRFAVIDTPFTIENGLMTPTMKVRRQAVRRIHGGILEDLYKTPG